MEKFNKSLSALIMFLFLPMFSQAAPTSVMQTILDEQAALGARPVEILTPAEARLQPGVGDAMKSLLAKAGKVPDDFGLTKVKDLKITGAAGEIVARVYTPATGSLPLIVYFHGGGWVINDRESYDGSARALAKKANAIVLSVDYRRAPETKFPAAHDDAIAAYKWALANAVTLGADPSKIAVAGESAGGNLAVNVAIAARDQGLQMPVHVLSIYPIAQGDMQTPSYSEHGDAKPLSRAAMMWFFGFYLNSPSETSDPRINLVGANLAGLPPTTIITAEIDPLRSEGEKLFTLLQGAGGDAAHRNYSGVTHEFFGLTDLLPEAQAAQGFAVQRLTGSF